MKPKTMFSHTRKIILLAACSAPIFVTGCQTHDRAAYNNEPKPVRLNSVRLAEPRTISGGAPVSADEGLGLPPEPGQSGLEGPSLIP